MFGVTALTFSFLPTCEVKLHRWHSLPNRERNQELFALLQIFVLPAGEKGLDYDSSSWWESPLASKLLQEFDWWLLQRYLQLHFRKPFNVIDNCEMMVCLCFFQGAFWGLMVGLVVGVCRMVLEFAFPPPTCGIVDSAPAVLRSMHYLHFAILLCVLTAVVVVVVSLLTPPPSHEQVCTYMDILNDSEGRRIFCWYSCNVICYRQSWWIWIIWRFVFTSWVKKILQYYRSIKKI